MCGIGGAASLKQEAVPELARCLQILDQKLAHRGPDGAAQWMAPDHRVGLAHRRLAIIDLSDDGAQPMHGEGDLHIAFNGEIYNYLELRQALAGGWRFRTQSDTECILAAYAKHGLDAFTHLRGMFGLALWDARANRFVLARDRFGIKPLYYTIVRDTLYFASEAKALLPFLPLVEIDKQGLAEYLTFQVPLTDATLFAGVKQLDPGTMLIVENGTVQTRRYWRLEFDREDMTADAARAGVRTLFDDAIDLHLRADVDIAAYVSGGVDSSLVALSARAKRASGTMYAFHGRFSTPPGYDESRYAQIAAEAGGLTLEQVDIAAADFPAIFSKLVRALDQPVAGPGAFPQYLVSQLAAKRVKVVLGGQGGDEVFGGYARYLVGSLDQAIGASIGAANVHPPLSLAEIAPGLPALAEYQPLMRQLWAGGVGAPIGDTYRRLVDRSADMDTCVDWSGIDRAHAFGAYDAAFDGGAQVRDGDAFNLMLRFDLERLLPALLQVEDRVSMAHGLEARVPFLDHPLVEFVAKVPTKVKFEGGILKRLLRDMAEQRLPQDIVKRRDKMGFPVPLKEWSTGPLKDFFRDLVLGRRARERGFVDTRALEKQMADGGQFSRRLWGLACLEQWQQEFIDTPQRLER